MDCEFESIVDREIEANYCKEYTQEQMWQDIEEESMREE